MAYVYCIENLINHKKYIGKTIFLVEKRGQKHWTDSKRPELQNRPLYKAFNKYGRDNFKIYTIECCSNEEVDAREQYGISFFDTYHNGYNATLGGEGKQVYYIPELEFRQLYQQHLNATQIAEHFGCCRDIILRYARLYNINLRGNTQRHEVEMGYNDQYVYTFASAGAAARGLIDEGFSTAKVDSIIVNIMRCYKGERGSAYGFQGKPETDRGVV